MDKKYFLNLRIENIFELKWWTENVFELNLSHWLKIFFELKSRIENIFEWIDNIFELNLSHG